MMEYVRKDLVHAYLQCGRNKALSADVIHGLIEQIPVADVREVMASAWIPVTERLPEENQKCLITTRWGWECLVEYRSGYFYGERWSFETTDVTAWMPMPEPYRGDE